MADKPLVLAVDEMLRKHVKPVDVPIIVTTSHADRETVRMGKARECPLPRLAVLFAERAE